MNTPRNLFHKAIEGLQQHHGNLNIARFLADNIMLAHKFIMPDAGRMTDRKPFDDLKEHMRLPFDRIALLREVEIAVGISRPQICLAVAPHLVPQAASPADFLVCDCSGEDAALVARQRLHADAAEVRRQRLRGNELLLPPQVEPPQEGLPLRRLSVARLEFQGQVPRSGHASPADDDGHRLVGEAAVGVLRFGHGAGQSGSGTVCPLSACEQSSKNWMLPSVTNEWQREHSNRLPGSSGCAALYVHQHSSPGLWCDA